jgi:hypothetical protein
MEMPDVRFDDILIIPVPQEVRSTRLKLVQDMDPLFIEVCEPGSIICYGFNAEGTAASGGVTIQGDKVYVDLIVAPNMPLPINVYVKVSGVRKGFSGHRFKEHTEEEMQRNTRFWNEAIKG